MFFSCHFMFPSFWRGTLFRDSLIYKLSHRKCNSYIARGYLKTSWTLRQPMLRNKDRKWIKSKKRRRREKKITKEPNNSDEQTEMVYLLAFLLRNTFGFRFTFSFCRSSLWDPFFHIEFSLQPNFFHIRIFKTPKMLIQKNVDASNLYFQMKMCMIWRSSKVR